MELFQNNIVKILLFLWIVIISNSKTYSQDLEPRFLSSVPMKTNFSGLVYGYSSGDILLNSTQIENLNAKLNTVAGFYGKSFKLLNKPAKFDVVLPYSFGKLNALVYEKDTSVTKNGFGDTSFRLSMILIGDEALSLKEFAKRTPQKFKLGTAFKVKAPSGRYDETKLINLGTNRWGFQLKVASSYAITKKIILEMHLDSWFFTENTNYFNGQSLKQKPLLSAQLHLAYIFGPKFWASASVGQVAWGETTVDGVAQDNNQENSKYALAASYKVGKKNS